MKKVIEIKFGNMYKLISARQQRTEENEEKTLTGYYIEYYNSYHQRDGNKSET